LGLGVGVLTPSPTKLTSTLKEGAHGDHVHEVMQDYPRTTDADDWLRLFRFHPEQKRIEVLTYSPTQDRLCVGAVYLTSAGSHLFDLDITDALGRYAQRSP